MTWGWLEVLPENNFLFVINNWLVTTWPKMAEKVTMIEIPNKQYCCALHFTLPLELREVSQKRQCIFTCALAAARIQIIIFDKLCNNFAKSNDKRTTCNLTKQFVGRVILILS